MTSRVFEFCMGLLFGIGLILSGMTDPGTRFTIRAEGGVMVNATVVPIPFYDPAGERQKSPD